MNDRSNEIIKQLNRLANERSLTPNVRNKIREAQHHIQDLNLKLKEFELVAEIDRFARSECA
jgi:hypothetical protein